MENKCECCNFKTTYNGHWLRHIKTKRHLTNEKKYKKKQTETQAKAVNKKLTPEEKFQEVLANEENEEKKELMIKYHNELKNINKINNCDELHHLVEMLQYMKIFEDVNKVRELIDEYSKDENNEFTKIINDSENEDSSIENNKDTTNKNNEPINIRLKLNNRNTLITSKELEESVELNEFINEHSIKLFNLLYCIENVEEILQEHIDFMNTSTLLERAILKMNEEKSVYLLSLYIRKQKPEIEPFVFIDSDLLDKTTRVYNIKVHYNIEKDLSPKEEIILFQILHFLITNNIAEKIKNQNQN